jgi:hypothetical protein
MGNKDLQKYIDNLLELNLININYNIQEFGNLKLLLKLSNNGKLWIKMLNKI